MNSLWVSLIIKTNGDIRYLYTTLIFKYTEIWINFLLSILSLKNKNCVMFLLEQCYFCVLE